MPSLAEKQNALIADLRLIPDAQERLMVMLDMAKQVHGIPEAERADEQLVKGCVSRVWLRMQANQGRCELSCEADAPMVRGLVGLLCLLYQNAALDEVASVEPVLWESLGLTRTLSPTRLNGLAAVRAKLREWAESSL